MERIFNLNQHTPKQEIPKDEPVQLFNEHLLIKSFLAEEFIKDSMQVLAVYYKERNTLLLASDKDEAFKKLHKTILLFVKGKNVDGDRSISMQEFLADWPEINSENRVLDFEYQNPMNILKVTLS